MTNLQKAWLFRMKKILLFEITKLLIAFGGCFLLFSLLPFSIYVLLLPVELIFWWFMRTKITLGTWIGISMIVFISSCVFSFVWITTGHTGLEFLLDIDVIRRKFR